MPTDRIAARPLGLLATVCLLWGTIPVTIEGLHLPAIAITAARSWIAAIALGITLAYQRFLPVPGTAALRSGRTARVDPARRSLTPIERRRAAVLTVAAGAILVVHWSLQFAAFDRAPASTVAFVVYLAPVGLAALAPFTLREPTSARTAGSIAVAVVGAALLTGATARADLPGVACAAGSALGLVALFLVAKPLSKLLGGLRAAFAELSVAALLLSVPAFRLVTGHNGVLTVRTVSRLAILGLVHTALFVSLQLWCLARVPAATAGVIGQLEPVGVVIIAALSGALPGVGTLIGGALVVGAGAVVATAHVPGRRTPAHLDADPTGALLGAGIP